MEKTIEEVLNALENCLIHGPSREFCDVIMDTGSCPYYHTCDGNYCRKQVLTDARDYLAQYKEDRKAIFPPSAEKGAVLDFLGRHPLVKIDGKIYLVRRYLPQENHWLLEKQKWNSALGSWYNCDDFDYIFDRFGHLVRKEG